MSEGTINKFELNTIINSIPECLLFTDYEGTLLFFNRKAIEDFFSITNDTLEIGKSIFNYFEEPGKATLKNIWKSIENLEGVLEYQHEFKTPPGQIVFFKFSLTLNNSEENIANVCITGRDVTKDKQAEEKLIKYENDYKNLLNNNQLPLLIYDLESYRFLEMSNAAIKLYGYSREEFLSMRLHDLINKEQIEDLRKVLNNLKDDNTFSYTQWQNIKKNGELIYVEISAVPFAFNNKNARLALVNDITQTKIAEEKVKRSEAQLTRAQEVAKVGSWETDLQTLKVSWSAETFRIFEIDPLKFTDDHPGFLDYVHPEDREKVETAFTESFTKESVSSIEHRIISGKGLIKIVEERWEIIKNEKGQPARAIGTCQDITVRKKAEQTVIESERKYRSLTESSMDAILLTLPTGEILSANSAACKLFGLTEEEICQGGRNKLLDVTDPQLKKLLDHRARFGSAKGELTFIKKDGSRFPGEVSSTIFADEYGKERTSIIISDISERKLAEEQIKKSENRYRTFFEQNLYGFYRTTLQGKILECNDAFVRMLKYNSAEDLMGTNAFELYLSPDDRNQFINDVIKEKKKYDHEGVLKCKDKSWLYYIENVSLLEDEKTGESIFEGIIINITERKFIELQLAKSNERFIYASKATTEVIWDWDLKTKQLSMGEGFEELFGYRIRDHVGDLSIWYDHIHPEDKDGVMHSLEDKILHPDETLWNTEYRYIRADGSIAYVLDKGIVLSNESGVYRMIGAMQDITDRKLAANLLNEMNKNLQKQAKGLVVSNEELERYAYVASHDLQEPLRMVNNFLQLLQQKYHDDLDETAREYINFAVDGAARMKILIMDLLEFSKISTSKQPHISINLNDVINKTRLLLSLAIDESTAEINVHFLPRVSGNESQLLQLFQNLISNAIKYRGDQKPIIEIGFKEEAEEWQFYVKDNGIGIDPKFFQKIFIIFQRLHSREEYSGTGIGLALCKKIVILHGGKIWVESAKGFGSTFCFTVNKLNHPLIIM